MSGGERGRILIVDDDEAARYVKSHLLRRQGYAVSEASLGRDALALAAAEEPHLTLLDVKLPDLSGIEVCREIKSRFPHIDCPADLGRFHRRSRPHPGTRWRRQFLSRRTDRAG